MLNLPWIRIFMMSLLCIMVLSCETTNKFILHKMWSNPPSTAPFSSFLPAKLLGILILDFSHHLMMSVTWILSSPVLLCLKLNQISLQSPSRTLNRQRNFWRKLWLLKEEKRMFCLRKVEKLFGRDNNNNNDYNNYYYWALQI